MLSQLEVCTRTPDFTGNQNVLFPENTLKLATSTVTVRRLMVQNGECLFMTIWPKSGGGGWMRNVGFARRF